VLLHVDAEQHRFLVTREGQVVKQLPIQGLHGQPLDFYDYLMRLRAEVQVIAAHHRLVWERTGDVE
jgi:hypothetical protein